LTAFVSEKDADIRHLTAPRAGFLSPEEKPAVSSPQPRPALAASALESSPVNTPYIIADIKFIG
jgi:hypothetical protein